MPNYPVKNMSQALARKYRPQDFDTVIGQETTVQILKNALTEKRLHHAYLFTGPRGIGKTSLARIFAKALNCQKGESPAPNPCNQCTSCLEITEGRSLSVIEIDGASNTSVEDVRDLRERIRYLPPGGRYKIYIIDEVHMLSTAAFNALLKTLEEPPAHAIFLFATTDPQKVPATVLSRVLRFDLRPIPRAVTAAHLKKIAAAEKIPAEEGALYQMAREAEGGLRDALSLMDQIIAFGGGKITSAAVEEVLGVSTLGFVRGILEAILKKDAVRVLKIAEEASLAGVEPKKLSFDLLEHLRHLLVSQVTQEAVLFDLPVEDVKELASLAQGASPQDLDRLFRMLQKGVQDLLRSPLPKVLLDVLLLRLVSWESLRSLDEILESITGTATAAPAIRPASTQPPPVRSVPPPRQTPVVDSVPPAPTKAKAGATWPDFLAHLRSKSPRLAALVEQGALASLTDTDVMLRYPPKSMSVDLLKEPERESSLKFYLQEFFGRTLVIRYEWSDPKTEGGAKNIVDDAISIFGPRNVMGPQKGTP